MEAYSDPNSFFMLSFSLIDKIKPMRSFFQNLLPKVSDLAVEQLHSSKNPKVKVAAGRLTTVALKVSCSHSCISDYRSIFRCLWAHFFAGFSVAIVFRYPLSDNRGHPTSVEQLGQTQAINTHPGDLQDRFSAMKNDLAGNIDQSSAYRAGIGADR